MSLLCAMLRFTTPNPIYESSHMAACLGGIYVLVVASAPKAYWEQTHTSGSFRIVQTRINSNLFPFMSTALVAQSKKANPIGLPILLTNI